MMVMVAGNSFAQDAKMNAFITSLMSKMTLEEKIGQLYRFKLKFGRNLPHIIFDGITNPAVVNSKVLCIRNNHNQSFANLDAANDFKNITRSLTGFECELPPVTVN
jgi:hypothetical protein